MSLEPQFPPLFSGIATKGDAFTACLEGAADGEYGAGDLVWSRSTRAMDFALVLEPTVDRLRCHEMLFVAMVAFGDALGALGPPETAVTYLWPADILVNDGKAGAARLAAADSIDPAGHPHWLVLGLKIELATDPGGPDPGHNRDWTNLTEEGCGELDATMLLESTSRHLLTWIHTWEEEGFKPIHDMWTGRMAERKSASIAYGGQALSGSAKGLDEHGNLIFAQGDDTRLLLVEKALAGASVA